MIDNSNITDTSIIKLLNEWYIEIRSRRIKNAHLMKKHINNFVEDIQQNQNLSMYYSLLNFRFDHLVNTRTFSENHWDYIDQFGTPTDDFLNYYYYFFKAIYFNEVGQYQLAREHFHHAENYITYIPDEIETAEFHYKLATFYYDTFRSALSITQVEKAKEIYSNKFGYETNLAFCDNLLGLLCLRLEEYELAEEYFISALTSFQEQNEEKFIYMVTHNLGYMYSSQDLSNLAIQYLSKVSKYDSTHYKSIFLEAREHIKLNQHTQAAKLIQSGLNLSSKLENIEYEQHFLILNALNQNVPGDILEKTILKSKSYFEKEGLFSYLTEYFDLLADKFYNENNLSKSNDYYRYSKFLKKEGKKRR
ncbi:MULTISPECIES: RapH N-terminal domain-containing protein [Bacillus cereus group]|uniref:RapH N-terminal domain-containing protein n=2 Tax=Bacillus cereus group TaxID=86661 RepID=A0AAW5L3I0_BACCE|nr:MULTISPECIES: RapH N-terminal domain-containing protein [Bacillus cereus group]MED3275015.1 RapH N-terminal domain-containing protein [Bacillus thuringiensis]MCQ6288763.1 RapH N-terminal domain-containing protein [Bacillus cereus]MCQ6315953.1 RapH N-terminal domain-containing protein [Bacillus cereus]MCQ6329507.1 RapH N-terminal domain-containing protein [Bacillus cereus]MCQ6339939.1 RapH N-terminal domain-containing protein [Bacillus cereus]